MAKKFGKFLFGTAVVGAAAAAVAYLYNQKKDEDEVISLDDEDEEDDAVSTSERSYTSLNHPEESGEDEAGDEELFTPLSETAKEVSQAVKEKVEKVEEFFDENDPTDDTSATEK